MKNNSSSQKDNHGNDQAKTEYEHAISLVEYHIGLLWQEFGVFLLAETVLLGFLGTALVQKDSIVAENWVIFLGSILGFLLCFPWYATFQHNYAYYLLRILQARRLETALGYSLLSEGQALSTGKLVHIGEEHLQLPILARHLPPRLSVPLLMIIFGTAFMVLIIISGPWW